MLLILFSLGIDRNSRWRGLCGWMIDWGLELGVGAELESLVGIRKKEKEGVWFLLIRLDLGWWGDWRRA